jgi:hypothetical protein
MPMLILTFFLTNRTIVPIHVYKCAKVNSSGSLHGCFVTSGTQYSRTDIFKCKILAFYKRVRVGHVAGSLHEDVGEPATGMLRCIGWAVVSLVHSRRVCFATPTCDRFSYPLV